MLSKDTIKQVLKEENQWFIDFHHHAPIGRENEDVVDNAYTRLCRTGSMPYTVVSEIYNEMRCKHA